MGREIKRVALNFDCGYLIPAKFREVACDPCGGGGYAPEAKRLHDLWYGYIPFNPADVGSPPLTPDTPEVWEFAERNVVRAPEYYGTGRGVIVREATRLADLWNGMWSHHLTQPDVDALLAEDRLLDLTHTFDPVNRWQPKDPAIIVTPADVNRWNRQGMGHDAINASIVIEAACERTGQLYMCPTCEGHGSTEAYEGQRAEAADWEPVEPPEGIGWQLWLATWMTTHGWGATKPLASSFDTAMRFVDHGWAPTGMETPETGYMEGSEFIGREQ